MLLTAALSVIGKEGSKADIAAILSQCLKIGESGI